MKQPRTHALDQNLDILESKYPHLVRSRHNDTADSRRLRDSDKFDQHTVNFEQLVSKDDGSKCNDSKHHGSKSSDVFGTFDKSSTLNKFGRKSYFGKNDNFKVCVRVRPLDMRDKPSYKQGKSDDASVCITHDEYCIALKEDKLVYDYAGKHGQGYHFDYVFGPDTDNSFVFERALQPMLQYTLDGFNVTCMAYGITGAGKTYTMLGNTMNLLPKSDTQEVKGVSELAMDYMFDCIGRASAACFGGTDRSKVVENKIKISYLEVYNEQVRDLLRDDKGTNLIILEDTKNGIILPGL